jgi:DNA-binding NarL/FixJ family response regulator
MSRIRILLADDHAITRDGTRRLLDTEADFEVVAEASDGEEAVRLAQELRPDILLLDISMPRLNGVQVAQVLRQNLPETRIVILTGYGSDQYAQPLVRLGVSGYLSKTASFDELVQALRSVQVGQVCLRPSVVALLAGGTDTAIGDEPTARELQVLRLVAEGHRNRDVARRLGTSERTVQFHLGNLFAKLQAGSRTEVVHRARERGWIA